MNWCKRWTVRVLLAGAALPLAVLAAAAGDVGQQPTARRFLSALQEVLADTIAEAEPSVVSVIRFRRGADQQAETGRPRQFPGRLVVPLPPTHVDSSFLDPLDPNYVPTDFGSGVIIGSDGLILTNYHVVAGAKRLFVRFHDGSGQWADLWATDPRSDLALLHVSKHGLKPIRMGNASTVRKGHIVIALGNPYATARDGRASASWGIISNVARRPPPAPEFGEITLHHSGTLLQTDARLNYGISGGALLNLDGQMIGLLTSLAAIEGFDQAAGYAIPLDETMLAILEVLRQGREVEYGFLGIQPVDVPAAVAGDDQQPGAMVNYCYQGTPAYRAGLRAGDIITAVDGRPIHNREQLILTVGTRFAGAHILLEVVRGSRRMQLQVRLAKYPLRGDQPVARVRPEPRRGLRVDYLSVMLREPGNRERLAQFPDGGVLVTQVIAESPADEAGLRPQTVITHVAGQPVTCPAEFYQAMDQADGPVRLTTDAGPITVQP